jgi:predicted nucleic acid-binding protein
MCGRRATRIETTAPDVAVAAALLRRLDLTLRTPDAVNIAIAQRSGSMLMTFDEKVASNAQALGMLLVAA